jgi:hypothetical protein
MDLANRAFRLRPASSTDFLFAWSAYEELMQPLTVELLGRWNEPGQKRVVRMINKHVLHARDWRD